MLQRAPAEADRKRTCHVVRVHHFLHTMTFTGPRILLVCNHPNIQRAPGPGLHKSESTIPGGTRHQLTHRDRIATQPFRGPYTVPCPASHTSAAQCARTAHTDRRNLTTVLTRLPTRYPAATPNACPLLSPGSLCLVCVRAARACCMRPYPPPHTARPNACLFYDEKLPLGEHCLTLRTLSKLNAGTELLIGYGNKHEVRDGAGPAKAKAKAPGAKGKAKASATASLPAASAEAASM